MAVKPRSAEIHSGPGFRVQLEMPRLEQAFMDEFRQFPTPDISDLLNRLYALDPEIRCLTGDFTLCGPACTVKVFPGDNLMVHKALDVARPGDIVVIDAGRSRMNAVLGDLISTKARHRKIAGFIIDGLMRDLPDVKALKDFPVFARGTTPIGPLHRGPGEVNYPICCGGIVINPGDIMVADAAGVVCVPRDIAQELLARLKSHRDANAEYLKSVQRGDFSNAWVDRTLNEQHCPYYQGSKLIEPPADQ